MWNPYNDNDPADDGDDRPIADTFITRLIVFAFVTLVAGGMITVLLVALT